MGNPFPFLPSAKFYRKKLRALSLSLPSSFHAFLARSFPGPPSVSSEWKPANLMWPWFLWPSKACLVGQISVCDCYRTFPFSFRSFPSQDSCAIEKSKQWVAKGKIRVRNYRFGCDLSRFLMLKNLCGTEPLRHPHVIASSCSPGAKDSSSFFVQREIMTKEKKACRYSLNCTQTSAALIPP